MEADVLRFRLAGGKPTKRSLPAGSVVFREALKGLGGEETTDVESRREARFGKGGCEVAVVVTADRRVVFVELALVLLLRAPVVTDY